MQSAYLGKLMELAQRDANVYIFLRTVEQDMMKCSAGAFRYKFTILVFRRKAWLQQQPGWLP